MTSEMFIENYRLDISSDISSLLTFELDKVKDFASRGTTWSKTIILPGTANNNKLFGHIFQIGQSNESSDGLENVGYNFNASRSADCIIFQDQLQTFKGVLRLMQINITGGNIEYEVAVFGQIAGLNVALSTAMLESLDFSAYDHVYNTTNIINSWDNPPGSGYYYPLIDYGEASGDKHSWDIRTFKPALYIKEYLDKMFAAAGYRYSSALIGASRFKSIVIPNNNKFLTKYDSALVQATAAPQTSGDSPYNVQFGITSGTGFTLSGGDTFEYAGAFGTTATIGFSLVTSFTFTVPPTTTFNILKNGTIIHTQTKSGNANSWFGTIQTPITGTDTIVFQFVSSNLVILNVNGNISISSATAVVVPISPGDTVVINDSLPKNIRQIDFLVSLVKLFNCYVYEDRFDTRLIYIKPYVDFYTTDSTNSVDWTYKLNRDKSIKIKPMSEINAKVYEFKYKSDSDYYNEQYRKRYSEGYGDYVFDSRFEFAEQKKSLEIIFSATPLVGYTGEEKVYPTIFKQSNSVEEKIDSNIRILQTKKITGVTSWDILDGPGSVLDSTTDYGYAGHLDDPDAPSNDLNFGVLRELYFTLVSGDLTATQFNVYWSGYMAEITDKDSKLMTAHFYLKPKDILDLDFSKFIFIDGVLFRLNSIKDYNVSRPEDCEVQLLKINFLIY